MEGQLSTGATPSRILHLGRVGVTIKTFSCIHVVTTRPAPNIKKPQYMFEMNKIMFRPNLDMSRGAFGFLVEIKIKAYPKLTIVMCCQILLGGM